MSSQICATSRLKTRPANSSQSSVEESSECTDDEELGRSKYSNEKMSENQLDASEDKESKTLCVHKYEVGVVVVSTSPQYIHIVGPLGDSWVETCVDPVMSLVFVEGVRSREVDSVKVGTMGHMVVTECVRCQFQDITDVAIAGPCLLWFGEEQRPSVRGAVGEVVVRLGDRMVVQLEGPPAARTVRLVLVHCKSIVQREIVLQTKVLVWAWARQQHQGKRGLGKFLEGAAVKKVEQDGVVDVR